MNSVFSLASHYCVFEIFLLQNCQWGYARRKDFSIPWSKTNSQKAPQWQGARHRLDSTEMFKVEDIVNKGMVAPIYSKGDWKSWFNYRDNHTPQPCCKSLLLGGKGDASSFGQTLDSV